MTFTLRINAMKETNVKKRLENTQTELIHHGLHRHAGFKGFGNSDRKIARQVSFKSINFSAFLTPVLRRDID